MRQISKYSTRKRLQKKIQKQVPPEFSWEARVGSGTGTVVVPGYKELRYVRPVNNDLPVIVHRGAAIDTEGVHVWVGKQHRREHLKILEASGENNASGTNAVPAHDHGPTSSNPAYIMDWQILPLCVYATTGMNVHANSGKLVYQGKPFTVAADDISLTDSVPDDGARYSLIRSNTVGVLDVQDGDPVDSLADLTDDDIPQCEAGYAVLAYVRLYEGQTSLSKVITNPDVRTVVWGGGLFDSGTAMLDEHAVGYGDAANMLTGDADYFHYDPTNKILTVGSDVVPSTTVPRIVVVGDGSAAGLSAISYGGWPVFSAWRANGTKAAPTDILLNDVLISMSSVGYAAGAWQDAKSFIQLLATENWTAAHRGAKWVFQPTLTGGSTTVDALVLEGHKATVGVPLVMYTNTKAAIEALTGMVEGATAYATNTDEFGTYNGAVWDWNSSGAYVSLTPTTDTRNVIQPSAATVKALIIKGFAAQSDNLLEFQDSNAVMLSRFGPTGILYVDHIGESTDSHGVKLDNEIYLDEVYAKGGGGIIYLRNAVQIDDDLIVDELVENTPGHGILIDSPIGVNHIGEYNTGHGIVFDNNVGIGVGASAPQAALDVAIGSLHVRGVNYATSGSVVEVNKPTSDIGTIAMISNGATRAWGEMRVYGQPVCLYPGATAALTAISSGNVGIRIATPLKNLTVLNSLAVGQNIHIQENAADGKGGIIWRTDYNDAYSDYTNALAAIYYINDHSLHLSTLPGTYDLIIDATGHFYPQTNKTKNLGGASNRWNTLYLGTSTAAGTSRTFESKRECPVCKTKMIRGTGSLCILGEDRDYEVAMCPKCGILATEEMMHLPTEKLASRAKPPMVKFHGFEVFAMSGNSRRIRVDFEYLTGKSESADIIKQSPITNSTYLGELELEEFLSMNEKQQKKFLLSLGEREWYALEESRLMEAEVQSLQAQLDGVARKFTNVNLLEGAAQ